VLWWQIIGRNNSSRSRIVVPGWQLYLPIGMKLNSEK
jgi:hypothetical protein